MNLAEFRHLLDVHGAHFSAWPDEVRAAAEHLVATRPEARALLQEAIDLDRLIMRGMTIKPKAVDACTARVLASLARDLPRQRRFALSWPTALLQVDFAPARLRIAALAGFACLGVVLGLLGPDIAASSASSETTLAAVFEPEPLTGVRP